MGCYSRRWPPPHVHSFQRPASACYNDMRDAHANPLLFYLPISPSMQWRKDFRINGDHNVANYSITKSWFFVGRPAKPAGSYGFGAGLAGGLVFVIIPLPRSSHDFSSLHCCLHLAMKSAASFSSASLHTSSA